jgi:hypothetical protein
MHPFCRIAAQVEKTVTIGREALARRGDREAVVVARDHLPEQRGAALVGEIPGLRRRRQLLAPAEARARSVGLHDRRPRPLRLGGQAVATARGGEAAHASALHRVEERQAFLRAQPVAVQGGVLPRQIDRRLLVVVQALALEVARGMAGAELAELRVADLGDAEVERPLQPHLAQCLIGPAPDLAPRRAHGERARAQQHQFLSRGRGDALDRGLRLRLGQRAERHAQ